MEDDDRYNTYQDIARTQTSDNDTIKSSSFTSPSKTNCSIQDSPLHGENFEHTESIRKYLFQSPYDDDDDESDTHHHRNFQSSNRRKLATCSTVKDLKHGHDLSSIVSINHDEIPSPILAQNISNASSSSIIKETPLKTTKFCVRVRNGSPVKRLGLFGTPDYLAPEVLLQKDTNEGWLLSIIM